MIIPTDATSYEAVVQQFRWQVPERFNIAEATCDRHAEARPDAPAVLLDRGDGNRRTTTFAELKAMAERMAAGFARLGVQRGDRVAVTLGQVVETLAVHLAVYKLGAIAVPIAPLYGTEGLAYRLEDSGTRLLVTDALGLVKVRPARMRLPALKQVVVAAGDGTAGTVRLEDLLADRKAAPTADTLAQDPALLFYTSGTSGPAKGVLHAHRVLIGNLPSFQLVFNLAPQAGDVFWTPSVWSWAGSLLEVVLAALFFGYPVVAAPGRFSPERSYQILADNRVTCPFLAPTALRLMRASPPARDVRLAVRAIMTGGERASPEVLDWARRTFRAPVNDVYGQTEANDAASGCEALFPTPPGAIGRIVPGRRVIVLDGEGRQLPPGELGEIAVGREDPIVMLGYWNGPDKTAETMTGGWVRTGDAGFLDRQGFLHFQGRLDDLIVTGGYRVGPEEVEAELVAHPAVVEAGAVGVPDEVLGEAVWAFVVLKPGHTPGEALVEELQAFVKARLAGYAYPRRIAFAESLPKTDSGKIRRAELRRRAAPAS
ncbi:MAG: acyl-CoA synthetase [Alphaproteobacteria bacterium]